MNKDLEALCVALDQLAISISSVSSDKRSIAEAHGWNMPNVSLDDLAVQSNALSAEIRSGNVDTLDPSIPPRLTDFQNRIGNHCSGLPKLLSPAGMWRRRSAAAPHCRPAQA